MKGLIKMFWYGIFINYHVKKQYSVNMKYTTLHRYHLEKAQHYYEKAYGKEHE